MTPEENTMHAHVEIGRLREAARSAKAMEEAVLIEFATMIAPFKPRERETITAAQDRLKRVVTISQKTYKEQAVDACCFSVYAAYCHRILSDKVDELQLRNDRLDRAVEDYHRSETEQIEHALNSDDELIVAEAAVRQHQLEVVLLRLSLFCFVFALSLFHLCGPSTDSLSQCLYLHLMALLLSAFNMFACCIICKIAFCRPLLVNSSRWLLRRAVDDDDRPAHELTSDDDSFEKRIIKFYTSHCPDKLADNSFAGRIAAKYSYPGGEAALFRTLNERYLKQD